jgi:hypothetical protein
MHHDRIRNILLGVIATLLFLNLGDRLIPAAHALGTKQYRSIEIVHSHEVQRVLDKASADGWEYVGSIEHVLIFRRFTF